MSSKTYRAMTTPVVGHRSQDFVNLFNEIQPQLQQLFYTNDPVYISTSSAWGVMEGALRNVCQKKVLNCMNGAFSDKWYDVSKRTGCDAGFVKAEWGQALEPDKIAKELATGQYDAITLIHNETSTGTMNPLEDIMAVVRNYPEVISIVDTVSSFSAVEIQKDKLGIDVMLTGSQKALALPPGLSLLSVSERALDRAAGVANRGYYFDFLEFQKNYERGMTPSTPNIPLIYALRSKLEDIFEEGLEERYERHHKLNQLVRAWAEKHGLTLLPAEEFGSPTLCCIKNTRDIDIVGLNQALRERYNTVIDCGYGKLKGKAFRISNMGDETKETIGDLLYHLDVLIPDFLPVAHASS